jgi:O-antigen ligase
VADPPDADEDLDAFAILACLFLCVALTVGGSSVDPLSVGVSEIAAIPLLAWSLWRLATRPSSPGALWPLLMLAAAVLLVAVQLIPLPPGVWSALPGRQTVVEGFRAAGLPLPWLPLAMSPRGALDCGLGLIPPAAMFLAMLTLPARARRVLAILALVVAGAAVALGMLQMAQGPASRLRFHSFTNPDSPVGFFANRNHQAAFLACGLPLAAGLMSRWGRGSRVIFVSAAAGGFGLVAALGAAATGSRAGALLVVLGCVGAVAIAIQGARRDRAGPRHVQWAPILALAAAVLVAGGLIALSADSALGRRFHTDWSGDLRFQLNPIVARAGLAFAPLGSGLGSFVDVFPMFQPRLSVSQIFINHAHDDYLEIWLECGWPGVALIAAFLAWWARGFLSPIRGGERAMALAGSVVIALLLVHSTVDYPLRMPALAALFAFACGLILSPPRSATVNNGRPDDAEKSLSPDLD